MEAFTQHTGRALPLRRTNVDTDQILPARWLKKITRTGFEDALFETWRKDQDFVLNRPEHSGATILVAGADFGIGSSREHAVWALQNYGFQAVISSRFGDIFFDNALKNGLLAVVLDPQEVEELLTLAEDAPQTEITIDLADSCVRCTRRDGEEHRYHFPIAEGARWRLLNGFDDISVTLRLEDHITAYEARRAAFKPRTLP
jgi:3-isopropylmalate/(R)-2-methylmalate dehydratase small subunit